MANTSILNAFNRMWQHVVLALNDKSDSDHNHNDVYYTETEIDSKISNINTSISNITNGTTKVAKATSADSASSATSADTATKATQDASGNVITSTYETKTDASAKLTEAKSYTDTSISNMVGSSSVSTQISSHNTSDYAHSDIRTLITDLTTKLNNFLDVDDTTTDQLSEVITLINNNKGTIESLTTNKINVSDIIDNLTTNDASKVLSASQGVVIKGLIDALQDSLDSHTHNYAGSSSAGGAATSANKLNTNAGSTTNPVYFSNGVPVATTYSLNKTVPSDAVFTDTTYSVATQSADGLMSSDDKIQIDNGGVPIVTTAGDGTAYTATVDGVTLTVGAKLTIIPHTVSTVTNPTLNVNGLGAKSIRMPVTYNTSATSVGATTSWLTANKPVTLEYDGNYWKTISIPRPSAQYLYGTVPVANGGTGRTDAVPVVYSETTPSNPEAGVIYAIPI